MVRRRLSPANVRNVERRAADFEKQSGRIRKMVHRNHVLQWGERKKLLKVQKTAGIGRELGCLKT